MIAKEDIIGTWKIDCCESRFLDGRIGVHPVGENIVGYILYNPDGYMALEMMAKRRLAFTKQDPFADSEEEEAKAARSHLSYCGTYELKGDHLIHHIEFSSYGGFIGHKIERYVRLEDDVLFQTTEPFFMHGESHVIHLQLLRASSDITLKV